MVAADVETDSPPGVRGILFAAPLVTIDFALEHVVLFDESGPIVVGTFFDVVAVDYGADTGVQP